MTIGTRKLYFTASMLALLRRIFDEPSSSTDHRNIQRSEARLGIIAYQRTSLRAMRPERNACNFGIRTGKTPHPENQLRPQISRICTDDQSDGSKRRFTRR